MEYTAYGDMAADKLKKESYNDLNGKISMDADGFMKVNIEDSKIRSLSFPEDARNDQFLNMRLLGKNVNLDGISLDSFDLYILENKEVKEKAKKPKVLKCKICGSRDHLKRECDQLPPERRKELQVGSKKNIR